MKYEDTYILYTYTQINLFTLCLSSSRTLWFLWHRICEKYPHGGNPQTKTAFIHFYDDFALSVL